MYTIVEPSFPYDGWPLSPICLTQIQELICSREWVSLNIIEFGSGQSTYVMKQFKEMNNFPGVYDVFDTCPEYAHPDAKIVPLEYYDEKFFKHDFSFYDLQPEHFSTDKYDLCILDGHLGAGRSGSYHHIMNRMRDGSLMVIDDYDHYPFEDNFLLFFPKSKLLIRNWEEKISERWIIYEVKL